jgi:hypothetical protein
MEPTSYAAPAALPALICWITSTPSAAPPTTATAPRVAVTAATGAPKATAPAAAAPTTRAPAAPIAAPFRKHFTVVEVLELLPAWLPPPPPPPPLPLAPKVGLEDIGRKIPMSMVLVKKKEGMEGSMVPSGKIPGPMG